MPFQEMNIKHAYDSFDDDIVNEFYIPALGMSTSYDRIAGYFSSTSLSVAARGIAGLVKNGGKMRLLASPHLSSNDLRVLKDIGDCNSYILECFEGDLERVTDEFEKDHVKALGWLLKEKKLEIRIVYTLKNHEIDYTSLFHQKVGILKDLDGNTLSFSGSLNETAAGWLENIEEIKVFKGWIDGQETYLKGDLDKFQKYWDLNTERVKTYPISKAIEDCLIEYSKDFDVDAFVLKKYKKKKKSSHLDKLNLFWYQKEALETWKSNNMNLLLEMATGTGKTRTAIACINEMLTRLVKMVCIVACPQNPLSMQWKKEVEDLNVRFDNSLIADGNNPAWRQKLEEAIIQLKMGFINNLIIYTTHSTCSNSDFFNKMDSLSEIDVLFIGDEVHGLGSSKCKNGLRDSYKYRLGLSATPERWFDEGGTKIIDEYFGSKSYKFTIKDALNTINPMTSKAFLVDYKYEPRFVKLNDKEIDDYIEITQKISRSSHFKSHDEQSASLLDNYLYKRANIIKSAENKITALTSIIDEMDEVKDLIIFTSYELIDDVVRLLNRKGIITRKFTQNEKTIKSAKYGGKSEREYIIEQFKKGLYQVLVAMKCLDEGIDIPTASTAILMSSSTNPREYVQRIGRVIRQDKNKTRATIYDLIVEIDTHDFDDDVKNIERKIFNKELDRAIDVSKNSINNASVLKLLTDKRRSKYGT